VAVDPELARRAYDRWKAELVTNSGAGDALRVRRPNNEEDTTVSEGIAYGMILSLVMDDQPVFDGLWKYSQKYLNQNGLMNWRISAAGEVTGSGAATDADEDMAWALALADFKWGGGGSLDQPYLEFAKTQIQRIWDHEVAHDWGELLNAGDSWNGAIVFNPSYFAPNQYRLFGKISNNVEGWNKVIDKGYEIIGKSMTAELGNAENGLIAAWTDAEGRPHAPFDGAPTHYQYDSARIPFRIGQDYCEFGEPRAKAYLDKVSSFFANVGASQIFDGYELNGTARAENAGAQSALFVGAAAVGAMSDPKFATLLGEGWGLLVTKEMFPPSYYYNLSWQVFSLMMLSGNLFDYTLHP
jgi:endo-1,4-beta-D-glucanase Y